MTCEDLSYERYEQGVYAYLRPLLEKCATGEDVETYLASDTVQKEIHSRYAKDIRDIQAGKFPPSAFEDCMDSVGYCLFMMYR